LAPRLAKQASPKAMTMLSALSRNEEGFMVGDSPL